MCLTLSALLLVLFNVYEQRHLFVSGQTTLLKVRIAMGRNCEISVAKPDSSLMERQWTLSRLMERENGPVVK